MAGLVVLLLVGLLSGGAIAGARLLDAQSWRRSLQAYRLRLPTELKPDDVASWLATMTAGGGSRFRLLDTPPVGLETVATSRGIDSYLLLPAVRQAAVLASLRAALPGVRIEPADNYLATDRLLSAAAELGLTSLTRPLATGRAAATVAAYLASLQPLAPGVEIRVQWLFTGCRTPAPVAATTTTDADYPFLSYRSGRDQEAIRAARLKQAEPLLRACCRIGVSTTNVGQAQQLLDRVLGSLRLMNAPGVSVRRRLLPGWWVGLGLRRRALPLLVWPLILNTAEAAGLVGLPVGDIHLPGLRVGVARQLPLPPGMPRRGAVIGVSNYPGSAEQPVTVTAADRLRHSWLVGPTGSGKSTLLGNLVMQDMQRDDSVILIDARGDLVPDMIARVPEHRRDDLIILDPANTIRPIGFNPLQAGSNAELTADHILHVLHEIFRTSWGPRTADILRASLLTLTHTKAQDGSAFTLVELPTLLTNPSFRRFVTSQPAVPVGLREFWQWYEQLSDAERASVIGPVLNKIRGFVLREPLRLLLGQSQGLQLSDIFRQRKILLVPLSKGLLGAETTQLTGSLLLASLWQTTLARVAIPAAKRRPVWLYVDEFQETVRLPIDLADMLAQARALGLGMTLAHQYLGQLPEAVKAAVQGTARTHISFQCGYDDATTLARSFAPLTREDLMGLEAYEIAIRPCVGGRTISPVTATTVPLPPATARTGELSQASAQRYGQPAAAVTAAIAARIAVAAISEPRIGRNRREPRS